LHSLANLALIDADGAQQLRREVLTFIDECEKHVFTCSRSFSSLVRESKTNAGIRRIPLDPAADRALRDYVARGRPAYHADGPEPMFLTDTGAMFTYWGWTSLARRLGERMRAAGFNGFMQHRARGSTAKLLQRRGVPLNVIQQIGGWEGPEMVRRYIGDYSVEELKTFPTVGLDQILMPDKDRGLPQPS
jgi:integrase